MKPVRKRSQSTVSALRQRRRSHSLRSLTGTPLSNSSWNELPYIGNNGPDDSGELVWVIDD